MKTALYNGQVKFSYSAFVEMYIKLNLPSKLLKYI